MSIESIVGLIVTVETKVLGGASVSVHFVRHISTCGLALLRNLLEGAAN